MAIQEISTLGSSRHDIPIGVNTIVEDFGRAFIQSSVISPLWNGVGQLVSLGHLPQVSIVNTENAKASVADSWAQKIGGALGVAADFVVLSKLKTRAVGPALNAETTLSLSLGQRSLMRALEGAKLGAFYGAVLTPSDPNGNLLWGRVANAGSEAMTFAVLSGGAEAVGGTQAFGSLPSGRFANAIKDMSITGAVGMPAGAISVIANSTLNGRKFTLSDLREAAADYGILGFGLAGITHGIGALRTVDPVKASEAIAPRTTSNSSANSTLNFNDAVLQSSLEIFGQSFRPDPFDFPGVTTMPHAGRPSVAELKGRLGQIYEIMSAMELPVSENSDPSSWKFIPEKATKLDAWGLKLPQATEEQIGFTEPGDRIVRIKRYINSEGQPGREYLSRIAKSSDITIIGEQHTREDFNPHRVLGAQVLSELPAGSTLAVELPFTLKPIFEEFNSNKGSDLRLASPVGNMLSMQPALSHLRSISSKSPELVDMWKAARDKGVRVVPIDTEYDSSVNAINELREAKIASELLALSDSAKGLPVVAWFGNMHAARSTQAGVPFLAKRIAESPQFASGNRRLNTVLTQLSDTEAEAFPLSVLAKNVREPVGLPTSKDGKEAPIGKILILNEPSAKQLQADTKVCDYDHVILYPPTPPEALAEYNMQRAAALLLDLITFGTESSSGPGALLVGDWPPLLAPRRAEKLLLIDPYRKPAAQEQ